MKKILMVLALFIIAISILVYGCFKNGDTGKNSIYMGHSDPNMDYNVKVQTSENFSIIIPYLYSFNLSDDSILSHIQVNNKDVHFSILEITNSTHIYGNLSFEDMNNTKALRIVGRGNTELTYRINGTFDGNLSLRMKEKKSHYNWVHNYYTFCNKSIDSQEISISINCKIMLPLAVFSYYPDGFSYEADGFIPLNEDWNVIYLSSTGAIA